MIRSCSGHRGLKSISARLRQLDGRDGPLAILALDRNSQTMKLVKPNLLHGPSLSIGEDYGLADKFNLSLLELAEDGGGVFVRRLARVTRHPRGAVSTGGWWLPS